MRGGIPVRDLRDGESVEVQGSASRPYQLKNVAGVYSCTCPAWRNQSLPIDRRSCKHLRRLRGDQAEEARVGQSLPKTPEKLRPAIIAPQLLLAESWDGESDVRGWWFSEKLDGVRCYWNGKGFVSRLGNPIFAPAWFTARLPAEPLDGELWLGRKKFQRTVSIVRRQDESELWKEIRYLVFDAPAMERDFEERLRFVETVLQAQRPPFARAHPHRLCRGIDHLKHELARVEALGGEGLMLRQPGSRYMAGRSGTLLKVKTFHDAEARVISYEPGRGRHKGRLGALLVQMADGTRFAVGTGLSDAERQNPPPVGRVIRFRYQELTDGGVPRFPWYVGVCKDFEVSTIPKNEGSQMATSSSTQRFHFVGGGSDKFWEISVSGREVTVRFGRNGTNGQSNVKAFPDETAAARHAESLIKSKLSKGYSRVS
jgi:DNA ligase-1